MDEPDVAVLEAEPVDVTPRPDEPGPALPVAEPAPVRPRRHETLRWVGVAATVIVVALAIGFFALRGEADGPLATVPFTSFPGQEAEPAFSPSGEQIAFTWEGREGGAADIYVKQPGAETPLQLTDTPDDEWSPAWSPDGLRIAFVRATEAGAHAVVVVPAIGGGERTLVEFEDREIAGIAWSPDGETLALSAQAAPAEPFSLFLLSAETLDLRRLTEPDLVEGGDVSPSFSPDGGRLAFVRGSNRGGEDLFVVPARGGEPDRLTRGEREIVGIDWTPDGQDLVFASRRREGSGLWRVAVAGGAPEWIAMAGEGEGVQRPSVARRGRRLTYEQRSADANIWAIRQGRFERAPLIRSTRWDSNPQFAPDGARIAFASDRSGSPEVWVVNAEGLDPIQLTDFGGPAVATPRWAPDGRQLAFGARVDGNADIYVIDANGGVPVRLTEHEASDVAPSWSQDSTTVYFSSNRSGTWEVWRMPSSGGTPTRVTYHGGYNAFESPDGRILYYAKKGESGLWRRGADDEEETLVLGALEPFDWGNWAVTDAGIYFLRREATGPTIRFYSFLTGRSSPIASLDDVPDQPSLAVSPDGRVLLYTHVDRNESDIVLVEDFQ
jgi:Tol biopolymer transport system component